MPVPAAARATSESNARQKALPGWLVALLATSCGLTVANLYYAQPLLEMLRRTFQLQDSTAGLLITLTQLGYAAGMVFLVPLGDRVENSRLVSVLLTVTALAMAVGGLAPTFTVLLIAALVAGATSVVAQVLVPYAADLAPDHLRGAVVGKVMSGLLAGILLSRTVGSLLADVAGWRTVYLVSAALMAILALVLRRALPRRAPTSTDSYTALLRSTARLIRVHPRLRRRSVYHACMFAAFSAFWTTISYVLTAAPYDYSQLQVGLFAFVGAAGALVAPLAGRLADRGLAHRLTPVTCLVASATLVWAGLAAHQILVLAAAAVLLDCAVQCSLIFGQHTIYQLDADARARITSVYIATFFIGGAIGSQLGTFVHHWADWRAVTLTAAAFPLIAALAWTTDRSHTSGKHRAADTT
ncbi:MFS transporter [Streptomyces tsukubensis]|uniref:MFS transporter n=1 Tax=Streptomyces tsukubensis TaxID=83656 RepID=A0A1V4AAG4_9ACTN|nr:MFS transporter [Streptomyces tsukubensis]OON80630.1 MFS transporter [Streptomyces tsukubensis]QFR96290.1 MFS transporter [Streptomyces tsukubensis]